MRTSTPPAIVTAAARLLDAALALSLVGMLFMAPALAERQSGAADSHASYVGQPAER